MSTETDLSALVVYESMFGCTRDVAAAVAAGLRIEGAAVLLVDVRDAAHIDEIGADLLVVGAPTPAFSLSSPATRQDGAAERVTRETLIGAEERALRLLAASTVAFAVALVIMRVA